MYRYSESRFRYRKDLPWFHCLLQQWTFVLPSLIGFEVFDSFPNAKMPQAAKFSLALLP